MKKIAIFGAGLLLNDYFPILDYTYDICCIVDNDKNKWGKKYFGLECQSPKKLMSNEFDSVVILTMWQSYIDEIRTQLISYGMEEKIHLIGELLSVINLTNVAQSHNCTDEFGNQIVIEDDCSIGRLCMNFTGTKNTIRIGRGVKISGNIHCCFRGANCSIDIGNGTSIIGTRIYVSEGGSVKIGKDCMIADSVDFMQSVCHPIYNIETEERINFSRDISIGNHVWVGQNSGLMSGFSIGDGSIVGYGSVSSASFPNNCTIAGNPARIIRENVTWKREAVGYQDYFKL